MKEYLETVMNDAVAALRSELGDNLYSCCVYGSAVRGNLIEGVSDVNLLIVLGDSTPRAHEAVAKAIGGRREIDPFVLGRRGFQRNVRAFASKFSSIQRNYQVLQGADPFVDVQVDPALERFLCEQGIRNLRLRLVYAFVTNSRSHAYGRYLARNVTAVFVQLSEVLRLEGLPVPKDFEARIPLFVRTFSSEAATLRDLLDLKKANRRLSDSEAESWHGRVFPLLDGVLVWIETHWKP